MRFLMFNWRDPANPHAGGAERVTMGYMAALAERGHQVYWFTHEFPGCAPQETLNQVHVVRGGGVGSSLAHAVRWYRRQPPFDLVIDQHHGIPWYAPWWCKTRCIAYIHEVLGPIWKSFYRWPLSMIGARQERWTHWLYRHVPFWTGCEATRQGLLQHGVRSVQVIPYGVHTQALPELPEKPFRPPLQLVVVSRIFPNKRIDQAIHTLACLEAARIDARLTVIGTGDTQEMGMLKNLTQELGLQKRVKFKGALPEPEKDSYLSQSHLLLHTSLREGWGLNVIEANALGTPAIVYPVAGLMESTLHDMTGRVAQTEQPEALAREIQIMLNQPDLYPRYRLAAWERAKEFHWSQILPKACDWLESQACPRGAKGK